MPHIFYSGFRPFGKGTIIYTHLVQKKPIIRIFGQTAAHLESEISHSAPYSLLATGLGDTCQVAEPQ